MNIDTIIALNGDKMKRLHLRSRKKSEEPPITPSIQQCTGHPSQYNKTRKKQCMRIEKEEKAVIMANDVFVFIENLTA